MSSKVYATFREDVSSIMPEVFPAYWVGVVEIVPNHEDGCITVSRSRVVGNVVDGFRVETSVNYRRIVLECNCEAAALDAVDHTAGHPETGWYAQRVLKTGVTVSDREVTVVELRIDSSGLRDVYV